MYLCIAIIIAKAFYWVFKINNALLMCDTPAGFLCSVIVIVKDAVWEEKFWIHHTWSQM